MDTAQPIMDLKKSAPDTRAFSDARNGIGASVDVSGETLRLRSIGPFTLRENLYASGTVLPKHSHPHAYITFVIEGAFRERYAGALHRVPDRDDSLPAGGRDS